MALAPESSTISMQVYIEAQILPCTAFSLTQASGQLAGADTRNHRGSMLSMRLASTQPLATPHVHATSSHQHRRCKPSNIMQTLLAQDGQPGINMLHGYNWALQSERTSTHAEHRRRPCELRAVVWRGVSRWFTPSACGPGSPELSKSDSDMASKLLTFTFTFTPLCKFTFTFTPILRTAPPQVPTIYVSVDTVAQGVVSTHRVTESQSHRVEGLTHLVSIRHMHGANGTRNTGSCGRQVFHVMPCICAMHAVAHGLDAGHIGQHTTELYWHFPHVCALFCVHAKHTSIMCIE